MKECKRCGQRIRLEWRNGKWTAYDSDDRPHDVTCLYKDERRMMVRCECGGWFNTHEEWKRIHAQPAARRGEPGHLGYIRWNPSMLEGRLL